MAAKRRLPIVLKVLLAVLLVGIVTVGSYVAYLQVNYTRISDGIAIENTGAANSEVAASLKPANTYTVMTYNIGFGAYTPDFTFFMDHGTGKDGTQTQGEHAKATSKESVLATTKGATEVAAAVADGSPADFMFFQEVDEDSTRSYHVDQRSLLTDAFPTMESFYAENFHSGFLAYPFHDMFGRVRAGMLTLSDANAQAVRRSYPIDEAFPTRYTDLDRCFCVLRIPVEGGRELVLINNHMSAYDEGGVIRKQQFDLLCSVLAKEYAAGNYVIAGGDWNHALCGSQDIYETDEITPDWLAIFDENELPDGFDVVRAQNLEDVATCRGGSVPYELGKSYRVTVDGFVVSDNVNATATNVDTGFAYSDHNPVLLSFKLEQ